MVGGLRSIAGQSYHRAQVTYIIFTSATESCKSIYMYFPFHLIWKMTLIHRICKRCLDKGSFLLLFLFCWVFFGGRGDVVVKWFEHLLNYENPLTVLARNGHQQYLGRGCNGCSSEGFREIMWQERPDSCCMY